MNSTVSVLITVYDGESFLREAVDSILAQTHHALELVIVDDGSKDATNRILATYTDPRVRVIRNDENIGQTRSLNRGLAEARGRYVARQHADDRSHPERIARQLAFLETYPDAVLIGCQARTIDNRGRVLRGASEYRPTTPLAIEWHLLFGSPFFHGGVVFR